jgi:hypothetical protein
MNDNTGAKKVKHSAAFQCSFFLMSKKCLDPEYKINIYHALILRYICDCIDANFRKTKKSYAQISHSQIATYCFCSVDSVKRSIAALIKCKLLKYQGKQGKMGCFYTGHILTTWCSQHYPLDIVLTALPPRCSAHSTTSYSSNFTNKDLSTNPQKQKASFAQLGERAHRSNPAQVHEIISKMFVDNNLNKKAEKIDKIKK